MGRAYIRYQWKNIIKLIMRRKNTSTTPEEILRATATEFNALHKKAINALEKNSNAATYEQILRDRARLLVALPHKLEETIKRGEKFPNTALEEVKCSAEHATNMLSTHSMFGLGALLTHKGSRIGDPNDLEKLINTLYRPKQPPNEPQK